jgi:hypothetical protein
MTEQRPSAGHINLDHVAHFVPDIEAARLFFSSAGFTLTPFSHQSHRLTPDGPLVPAGSGNCCIMLPQGYIEVLTPTADTPIAAQLNSAIARYTGVHLIAFGSADAGADGDRLRLEGFNPQPVVALQRQIGTPTGEETARFSVVRVPPGTMEEGRIQYCQQHTPEWLWQDRWLTHANGAVALSDVLICVDDPLSVARRYGRFTGLRVDESGPELRIDTERGSLLFMTAEYFRGCTGIRAPALPWIAGYRLRSRDIGHSRAFFRSGQIDCSDIGRDCLLVPLAPAVGGCLLFHGNHSHPQDPKRSVFG